MAKTNHLGAVAARALVAVGLVLLIMLVVEARPAETFPGMLCRPRRSYLRQPGGRRVPASSRIAR
jgi:hypothetical protein